MLSPLTHVLGTLSYYALAYCNADTCDVTPRRKGLIRPEASETFVLPIRQSFVKDARLMPGTTRMLCLLAGWAGTGRPVETTLGILAKHLGRSERQIQRYLKDAAEEGYLYWTKVANRLGYIIGLRIKLIPAAIFAPRKATRDAAPKREIVREQPRGIRWAEQPGAPFERRNPATTDTSDTNEKILISKDPTDPWHARMRAICERNGIAYQTY